MQCPRPIVPTLISPVNHTDRAGVGHEYGSYPALYGGSLRPWASYCLLCRLFWKPRRIPGGHLLE